MTRRELIGLLGGTMVWPLAVRAQQLGKIFRVGCAYVGTPAAFQSLQEAFVSGMHELGYVEGKNIVYDLRYAENDPTRLPALIDELISLKPDVLAGIEPVARVMLSRTSTIPIVMFNSADPVAAGLVRSLSRPGGNVTGVSMEWAELGPKQLQLLREILPTLARVGHLLDTSVPASKLEEQVTRKAADSLGIAYVPYYVANRADLDRALTEIEQQRPDALIRCGGSGLLTALAPVLYERVVHIKIPMSVPGPLRIQRLGPIVGYGPNLLAGFRLAATYVDRILKGANASDLPIQQPMKFELTVSLKAANALGITVPAALLARADRVIE